MRSLSASGRVVSVLGGLSLCFAAACSDDSGNTPTGPGSAGAPASAGAGAGGAAGAGAGGVPILPVAGSASGGSAGGVGGAPAGGAGGVGGNPTAGAGGLGGAGGAIGGNGGSGGMAGMGGGSAGAGGMAPYNPCPTNGDPCRIMPLGDSITDGVGSSTGASYRLELFRLSLMNQKKLTFVGSHESGPDKVDNVAFPKRQEGHSGWTIDDGGGRSGLYPKIEGWLKDQPPHIVTLMIGTNDIDIQLDVNNAPTRLGKLLDRIADNAPNALIVVAKMVPTTDDTENMRVRTYNDAIPELVQARATAGKHIAMVDMYGAFTKNDKFKTEYMNDKLHPKDAGYVVMANTWYAVLGGLLK